MSRPHGRNKRTGSGSAGVGRGRRVSTGGGAVGGDAAGARERPAPAAAELAELRGRTAFGFPATQERVACRYCLHITEEGDALAVSLTADTAYLPPETIRAHLYGIEELIVAAASGRSLPLTGVRDLLEATAEEVRA